MVVTISVLGMMGFFQFEDENTGRIFLAFVVTLLSTLIFYRWFQRRKYPPGPYGLPFIGYYAHLGKEPDKKLMKLGEKYGKIMCIRIMSKDNIIINDFDIAKEILNHPATLARPPNFTSLLPDNAGFVGKAGAEWQEQRRFCVQTMKNLGLGRGVWETMIQEDAIDFVKEVKKFQGKPFDIMGPLSLSQAENNIALLTGKKFGKDKSNPEIQVIEETIPIMLQALSSVDILANSRLLFNTLTTLSIGTTARIPALMKNFENIFRSEVVRRMNSSDADIKEDFIGLYLQESKKQAGNKNNFFSVENLVGTMMALFTAGYDSTLSSLTWLLILMATYPEVQKKVHEEMDEVVGRDGVIYWDQRTKLPYTWATIMEMERFTPIVGLFPPREAIEEFEFNGYTIPKGASIITNGYAISRNPKYHKNADEFKPERFLKNDGKESAKVDGYGPFSFGKRMCPGEVVALMTIFLYFTNLMQNFRVTTPPGKKADFTPVFGAVIHPRHQNLCFIER